MKNLLLMGTNFLDEELNSKEFTDEGFTTKNLRRRIRLEPCGIYFSGYVLLNASPTP